MVLDGTRVAIETSLGQQKHWSPRSASKLIEDRFELLESREVLRAPTSGFLAQRVQGWLRDPASARRRHRPPRGGDPRFRPSRPTSFESGSRHANSRTVALPRWVFGWSRPPPAEEECALGRRAMSAGSRRGSEPQVSVRLRSSGRPGDRGPARSGCPSRRSGRVTIILQHPAPACAQVASCGRRSAATSRSS